MNREERLDALRVWVNRALADADDLDLVTDDEGQCHVVVALDEEPVSTILGRVRAVGGYCTVFSSGERVRAVSFIASDCAIAPAADSLAPGPGAEFGMFIDYVTSAGSVSVPFKHHPAQARDVRDLALADS